MEKVPTTTLQPIKPQAPHIITTILLSIIAITLVILSITTTMILINNKEDKQPPNQNGITPTGTTTPVSTLVPTITPTDISTPQEVSVKIYMLDKVKFNTVNQTEYTTAVLRNTTRIDIATFSVEEVIKGPTVQEKETNLTSTFGPNTHVKFVSESTCNGKDFQLNIKDKDATVQFCKGTSLSGDSSGIIIVEQISKTLKEFNSISRVRILNTEGTCLNDMSGRGITDCWK